MSKYFDGYASFDYEEMSKEKLILELKEKIQYIGALKKEITYLEKQLAEKKEDKISFAVEQLEKVKKFVAGQLFITTKDCSDLDEAEAKGCNELREETIKEIDNQIKVLKGDRT